MTLPRLTFFSELDDAGLRRTFTTETITDLAALGARVSLGILDLSGERAEVVRRLNQAGIPVTAWLLLPQDQGYWFNLDNAQQAAEQYLSFRAWTEENRLVWAGVGLDIEPDIREFEQWANHKWRLIPKILCRAFDYRRLRSGLMRYKELVAEIQQDGYRVESYQIFVIQDERVSGSSLLQRALGIVDIPVDREVWMLYSSFFRPDGAGLLWNYGPDAPAIAVGSTGFGVETALGDPRPLNWEELSRDLRLAWHWSSDLYIFSLEGCIDQGFLPRLRDFVWDQPMLVPEESAERVEVRRRTLQSALWFFARIPALFAGAAVFFPVYKMMQRKNSRSS